MSDTKEAWEHIAGELPPGDARVHWRLPSDAWEAFENSTTISKKRYAELIAPQRVREALQKEFGRHVDLSLKFLDGEYVFDWDAGRECDAWGGPDICTAAWAAIQALGGGE